MFPLGPNGFVRKTGTFPRNFPSDGETKPARPAID